LLTGLAWLRPPSLQSTRARPISARNSSGSSSVRAGSCTADSGGGRPR